MFKSKKPSERDRPKPSQKKATGAKNTADPASPSGKADFEKPPRKQRVLRWYPLIAVFVVLFATLFYLDVFGLKGALFSSQEQDPITQVRGPADFVEGRLKAAKAVALLDNVPEPARGTVDLFVRDGHLYYAEDGKEETLVGSNAEVAAAGDLKLVFSFSEEAPDSLSFLIGHLEAPEYDMLRTVRIPRIQGSAGRDFAVARLYLTENGMAPIVKVEDLSFNVQKNAAFALPKMINAVLADGSKTQVPITWSPWLIDTSEIGVRGSIGTIEGYDQPVNLTLIISDQVALQPETSGAAQSPPEESGAAQSPPAQPVPEPAPTPKPAPAPKPTPAPKPAPAPVTIQSLNSVTATVKQGESYKLPSAVTAVMSDKTTKNVPVTWNPASLDTSSAGTKTSTGTVTGTSVKAMLTLTVTPSTLAAPQVAVSQISGTDVTVKVTGQPGATVLFNDYGVGTIGSNGILTVTHVNIDILQSVRLTMAGWNPSPAVSTFVLY
ncbi:Ig-like domain-containing protein [Acidaminobacter hydrogenoformans]|uniref:Ig-like domain (Group 4) n=1 Tax=Acidaminobacter hydrogenoformans DSM 2784 TaxID=1120920 RepID=A0A1G5RVS4_9FIRM|nr:Ig-like domain-containing protein [Acidaminobacter hydrogenoformans]SCZ78235.1 Ig-like domain (group 4) [Acidaminobacter hydrogenoformans DSM 2784]